MRCLQILAETYVSKAKELGTIRCWIDMMGLYVKLKQDSWIQEERISPPEF